MIRKMTQRIKRIWERIKCGASAKERNVFYSCIHKSEELPANFEIAKPIPEEVKVRANAVILSLGSSKNIFKPSKSFFIRSKTITLGVIRRKFFANPESFSYFYENKPRL